LIEAEAQAKAIDSVARSLSTKSGDKAARLELARDYMRMMGEIGKQSNTIFFGEKAGDISTMMARVASAFAVGITKGENTSSISANDVQESESQDENDNTEKDNEKK
jgi:hypothetical protein